jgi:hypothetical protein
MDRVTSGDLCMEPVILLYHSQVGEVGQAVFLPLQAPGVVRLVFSIVVSDQSGSHTGEVRVMEAL